MKKLFLEANETNSKWEPKVISNMLLFQWHYLTAKCYISLEFPAWAKGRPGPWCYLNYSMYFSSITSNPLPLTHACSTICQLVKKEGRIYFPCTNCNFFSSVTQLARTKVKPQKEDSNQPLDCPAAISVLGRAGLEIVIYSFLLRIKQHWHVPC